MYGSMVDLLLNYRNIYIAVPVLVHIDMMMHLWKL